MTDEYYHKYLKYKHKISQLIEQMKQMNQIGGRTLFKILTAFDNENDFADWYESQFLPDGTKMNAYQILQNLLSDLDVEFDFPLNVLVGATSESENDYFRFKDSDYYSVYIDNAMQPKNPIKQYHMFTIDYDTIGDFRTFKPNSIDNIHFDTGTSYFAPIKYLEFAEHALKNRGQIVWDLIDRGGLVIARVNGAYYNYTEKAQYRDADINADFASRHITVDTMNKRIIPAGNEFFDNNTISPQTNISIVEFRKGDNIDYDRYPLIGFLTYCQNRFRSLEFSQKNYTYENYSYPVPIRLIHNANTNKLTINVFDDVVNFFANVVMNSNELQNYVDQKSIARGKLIELIQRVIDSEELSRQMKILLPKKILNISDDISLFLDGYIIQVFTDPHPYVVGTKI